MKKFKNIAIIPARGNSKRLPKKNTLLFGGIPLIVHSIKYAETNGIEKIIVSTDDSEIKAISIDYGAEVVDRPYELAVDDSPTVLTLKHVLESMENSYENVILLQPTNPLRPKKLLFDALNIFEKGNYDSLMTVTESTKKLGKIINNNFVPYTYKMGQRSQDLEPLYYENGLLYITKAELILRGEILGENNYPFIVNHPFATVDIDTEDDLEYAKFLINKK
ncbi:cytidylyltransferase domain-containing protein [Lutibacter sp. B1]|uniref:acylneuraminate cytidylyltransferase family protein n=1 Tax=Lutibacter sp. B1 TaxID=2725996 RepID=UPI001456C964|nr:acylneuraminate cytidylyltransferase family protein [Lutibacter sp. B1]NLP58158.1 acylneuraminate cytidylyltransferase family protein [Lutibacter sp. B1]